MKRALIVSLLCLNATLLVWLVFVAGVPSARAQVEGGGNDYMLLTAKVQGDLDGLYLLDLASRKIRILKVDMNTGRMAKVGLIELKRDFNRPPEK